MKITIVGCGILGTVQENWLLNETNHEVLTYDIDSTKCNSSLDSAVEHSSHFILCLPSDSDKKGRLNTSIIESTIDAISILSEGTEKKIIIIRSTVPVGFSRKMAEKYPKFQFYFIPEFLTEKTAAQDFENPTTIIIGVPNVKDCFEQAEQWECFGIFPTAHARVVPFEVAELLKLSTNSFYAMKVIFANEVSNLCGEFGVSYDSLRNLLAENPRIGSNISDNQGKEVHLRIAQDGQAGFGGKCLEKDLSELVRTLKDKKCSLGLLDYVEQINKKIRYEK